MSEVQLIKCLTWEHFIQVARDTQPGRLAGPKIYRGHADADWKLASKFERWLDQLRGRDSSRDTRCLFGASGPEAFERGYLERFKNAAIGIPQLSTASFTDDDWWILGRHHGLVTRLLDWTYSPYVAAFFAFAEYAQLHFQGFAEGIITEPIKWDTSKVIIWTLAPYNELFQEGECEIITGRKDAFYRQRAQTGLFTRLRHDVHMNMEAYLESKNRAHYLERIEVPTMEIGKALNDLRLMNITYATLFPDIDGAARDANLSPLVTQLRGSGIVVRIET